VGTWKRGPRERESSHPLPRLQASVDASQNAAASYFPNGMGWDTKAILRTLLKLALPELADEGDHRERGDHQFVSVSHLSYLSCLGQRTSQA
jgi:hypothetical protein